MHAQQLWCLAQGNHVELADTVQTIAAQMLASASSSDLPVKGYSGGTESLPACLGGMSIHKLMMGTCRTVMSKPAPGV